MWTFIGLKMDKKNNYAIKQQIQNEKETGIMNMHESGLDWVLSGSWKCEQDESNCLFYFYWSGWCSWPPARIPHFNFNFFIFIFSGVLHERHTQKMAMHNLCSTTLSPQIPHKCQSQARMTKWNRAWFWLFLTFSSFLLNDDINSSESFNLSFDK